MDDKEKFAGFKQKLIEDNEGKYGEEIRAKYGDETVNRSNAKVLGMTQQQYEKIENLSRELNQTLASAFEQGDPTASLAQKACALHKQWLCCFWDTYSKEAHLGLAEMYVNDPRFTAYYDKIKKGCAVFLRDAIRVFCGPQ